MIKNYLLVALVAALTTLIACRVLYLTLEIPKQESGVFGNVGGVATSIATTSTMTVGTTPILIFATTSPNCSARVVTTYASAVMLTFSDRQGTVPTGMFGHLQAASTTVAYDSELYGCDAVRAYSFASQAITVSEGR